MKNTIIKTLALCTAGLGLTHLAQADTIASQDFSWGIFKSIADDGAAADGAEHGDTHFHGGDVTHSSAGSTDLGFNHDGFMESGTAGVVAGEFRLIHYSSISGKSALDFGNPRTGVLLFDEVDLTAHTSKSFSMTLGNLGAIGNNDDVVVRLIIKGTGGTSVVTLIDTRERITGELTGADLTPSYYFADTDLAATLQIDILADDSDDGYSFDNILFAGAPVPVDTIASQDYSLDIFKTIAEGAASDGAESDDKHFNGNTTHSSTESTDLGFNHNGFNSTSGGSGLSGVVGGVFQMSHYSGNSDKSYEFDSTDDTAILTYDPVDLTGHRSKSFSMNLGNLGTNDTDDDIKVLLHTSNSEGTTTHTLVDTTGQANGIVVGEDLTPSYIFADTDLSSQLEIHVRTDDNADGYSFDNILFTGIITAEISTADVIASQDFRGAIFRSIGEGALSNGDESGDTYFTGNAGVTHASPDSADLGFTHTGAISAGAGKAGVVDGVFNLIHYSSTSGQSALDFGNPRTGFILFDIVDLTGYTAKTFSMDLGNFGTNDGNDDVVVRLIINGAGGESTITLVDTRGQATGEVTGPDLTPSHTFLDTDKSARLQIDILTDNPDDGYSFDNILFSGIADKILSSGSSGWSYLNITDGVDPAVADADFDTTWYNPTTGEYTGGSYDGPAFTAAQAPFHYGGVDGLSGGTTLTTPITNNRYTTYFHKVIDGGAGGYTDLNISMLADDGAFVYLNGVLIARDGVTGSDTFTGGSSWGDEDNYDALTLIGNPVLHPGANLLAISVHNQVPTDEDLGFDLRIEGRRVPAFVPIITRGPYLQSGSHDRMTVKWRTSSAADTILRYGDAPDNLTQIVTINETVVDHTVTITDLTAATQYYYQIESNNPQGNDSAGADVDHYFKTHPSPGTNVPARFWIIGDSGTTNTRKMNVYNAYLNRTGSTHTDGWLMLGDNAYNKGSDLEFQAAVFNSYPELLSNTVLWSCQGNHETDYGNSSVYPDIHHFPTAGECGGVASGSELYYSFNHGNIHFICLNTSGIGDHNDAPGNGGMIDWLEMDLKATTQQWIIAYFHHGPYTKGSHDSDTEGRHIAARNYMTPLLEKYGVDLVFSGHSHLYERSMLINGHHSNMNPATSSLSGDFVPETHIVDGGNGSDLGSNSDPLAVTDTSGVLQVGVGADGAYQKPLAQGQTGSVYIIAGASGKISPRQKLADDITIDYHPVFLMSLRAYGSCIITTDGANSMNVQYLDDDITGDGKGQVRDDFTILKGTTTEVVATDDTFGEYGGDNTATFTLTRTGATSFAETVNYTISGSTTNGVDYTPTLTGNVIFAADETSKILTVTRATDDLAEGDESLTVTLSPSQQAAGTGGALRDNYFIGTNTSDTATLADSASQLWWFNNFGAANVDNAMWESDSDNDGLDRLMEYAFGGTVGINDAGILPTLQLTGNTLELLYNKNNTLTDISFSAFTSTDLSSWTQTGVTTSLNGASNPSGVEAWKSSTDLGPSEEKRFLRLEINRQ